MTGFGIFSILLRLLLLPETNVLRKKVVNILKILYYIRLCNSSK
jgi:hypothetical protein